MALKSKPLLIIIPVYNEEIIISKTIKSVINEVKINKINAELLFIDDGSTDKTTEIIKKHKRKERNIHIIQHNKNKGYGKAINTGLKYANKNNFIYSLFMDSDLTNDPKDIKKFVNEINSNYDCIKASRYINKGKIKNVPFERIIISRVGNLIASILFNIGVKDCTNGFQMIKSEKFKKTKLKENSFPVIMEIIYLLKKSNSTFKEIPVTLINRKTGKSSFKYSISTYYNYIKYPIKSLWL